MIQCYSDPTMPARVISDYYAEYHKDMPLACDCGWRGPASEAPMEIHDDLFDRSCPTCDTMLLIVGYPTAVQMRAAAAAGNEEAVEDCRAYGVSFDARR